MNRHFVVIFFNNRMNYNHKYGHCDYLAYIKGISIEQL